MTLTVGHEAELIDAVARFYDDPLGFVRFAYPWGEPGALAQFDGPDKWQTDALIEVGENVKARGFNGLDAVQAIRYAVASGHGIGKSTLVAWLVGWIMSTRPECQGTVTANTATQLETKTWPAIDKWMRLCITNHWFIVGASWIRAVENPKNWYVQCQTCREENSEAFAGQHAVTSTSFYIFDEASAIPDKIWDVAEGGLTDGEPMIFAFGNPTRNTGKFYRVTYGSDQARWIHRAVDSRESRLTNKAQIKEWAEDYGEDSDFFRVRVRGLPPLAGELQFIDAERINFARSRHVETLPDEPLIAGFDVSGGGSAWNVIRFRRGLDGRSIPPIRITGEAGRDRSILIARAAEVMRDERPKYKVAAMFVDSAFGSPIVERLHVLGFENVHEVSFGAKSPDKHQLNQRAFMWNKLKEWLLRGAIFDDEKLAMQIGAPGYHINNANQLVLESKADMIKRGEASPDDADALALTFARPVAPVSQYANQDAPYRPISGPNSWMA